MPRTSPARAEAWIALTPRDRAIMAAFHPRKGGARRTMRELHAQFPEYGFDRHKGYACMTHLLALRMHGPCPHHRRSFAPVREALAGVRQCVLPGLELPA